MDQNSPEAMFNKMMEQAQDAAQEKLNNPQTPTGQTGAQPALQSQDQVTLNQMQNNLSAPVSMSTPISTANPNCPECGLIHPPLQPGKKCAGAKVKVEGGDKKEVDVNKYLSIWRDVVITNISKKEIKDAEKLFQHITVEIVKILEGYTE